MSPHRMHPSWLMSALLLAAALAGIQLLSGFQRAEASTDAVAVRNWISRKLSVDKPLDRAALTSTHACVEANPGQPEQRLCTFENILLYNGRIIYISDEPGFQLPPIKISWLKKFEGDDMLHPDVLNRSSLPFQWEGAQVEEIERAGLFHQSHYSNFYHMFSEVAPTVHNVLCRALGDCTYSPTGGTQLIWIEEHKPGNPDYIMLDSIKDTFRCLTPLPVLHKDNPVFKDKVLLLRKAVIGVGPEVRVFHNWEKDLQQNWREPPAADNVRWRQRVADCFGFNFTQQVASTNPMRILFINRHYEEGRMILNAHKIAHFIKQLPEYQAFQNAEIQMHYLEADESIRYQAELFWNASMLIWPHGATMAHTIFLPRGAQAIEVVPWVQEDKANLPEWVQAIRDAFSLDITLYDIQNKERARVMFNQDKMLEYEEYRRLTPEQKVALLERGECPEGIWDFLCPFWWNHWKVSVNFNWDALRPLIQTALKRLADRPEKVAAEEAARHKKLAAQRKKGGKGAGAGAAGGQKQEGQAEAAAAQPAKLQEGAGGEAAKAGGKESRARMLSASPPAKAVQQAQAQQEVPVVVTPGAAAAVAAAQGSGSAKHPGEELLSAPGHTAANGVPLSSYECAFDDGKAENRLCVFTNLLVHGGQIYYVSEGPVSLPEIQIAWEDWTLDLSVKQDKFFVPQVVNPAQLPFAYVAAQAEVVERAGLVHAVDSGNFYHLVSEVQPTFFANWCALLGICKFSQRRGFQLLFIHPDPKHYFGVPPAAQEGFNCLSDGPVRNIRQPELANHVVLVKHGVVGIGPYMRAYERQDFRKAWQDPPPGVMTQYRRFLSDCTKTGFVDAVAPADPIRITFINRPYSSGRMFLNLPEILTWIQRTWLPQNQNLLAGRRVEVVQETVREEQSIAEQINVFKGTSLLIYPHGATMTHAIFLPRGSVALEVIQWPNVTEPHGWLQSIRRQYEMEDVELLLMVNAHRDHLVLNWHALAQDELWRGLSAEEKVALQETGACPADKEKEARCFFDWLHWRSNLVLNKEQLGEFLGKAMQTLMAAQQRLANPGAAVAGTAGGGVAAAEAAAAADSVA